MAAAATLRPGIGSRIGGLAGFVVLEVTERVEDALDGRSSGSSSLF